MRAVEDAGADVAEASPRATHSPKPSSRRFASISASSRRPSAICSRRVAASRRHLLLERLVVLLGIGGADVAAGREDVAVAADLVERG